MPRSPARDLAPEDGRTARTARTREAIADAVLAFLEEGRLEPTSLEIAARAGIGERTIFHHFADLEALFAEVADRQVARVLERFSRVPATGGVRERALALAAQRADLHEFVTPVRRAALRKEPTSREIAKRLAWARALLRRDVERIFAAELERAPAAERAELRAALALAASWSAWEQLRRHGGLRIARARDVVARTLLALLGEK
ncbi:MAG TPA: TetR/AcrR family transcriptional regulator [Myxococcota bacterium]|nr:TetR/AcrR family transcriptional regulator [Myxococcota bacterium]